MIIFISLTDYMFIMFWDFSGYSIACVISSAEQIFKFLLEFSMSLVYRVYNVDDNTLFLRRNAIND